MAEVSYLPRYQNGDIHTYISQVRKFVFFSQQDAADYFRLDRSRISRYESDSEPDAARVGYIACLLKLVADRQANSEAIQAILLRDANTALLEHERHVPFTDWVMLCNKADAYLEQQHRNYVEKWIIKNFPQKLSKAEQVDLLKNRVGPASYHELIGMNTALHELRKLLLTPGPPWIVAIIGLGGIGKTSLAHALALDSIHTQLFDNIGWIRIRQTNREFEKWRRSTQPKAFDMETLFDQLLLQLAPDVYKSAGISTLNAFDLLQTRLTQIPHLVVIDNLETLVGMDELIAKLQALANPTKFLLTSRINLPDEPMVYSYPLLGLGRADAITLMRGEAAVRNVLRFKTVDDTLLSHIYDIVGGNPLALRLVVGQAISRSVDTILTELSQLKGTKNEAFFDFIFTDTWQHLSRHARLLLQSMCLSTNHGVSLAYLAALTKLPPATLRSTLDQLVAFNLINSNHAPIESQVRYTIHSLTRTYLHYLAEPDFASSIQTSLINSIRYVRQRIQATEGILSPEDHEQSLHTLRYGLERLKLWASVRPLLLELAPKMEQAGLRESWVAYLKRGIRFSKHLRDAAAEAELRFHLGILYQRRSNYLLAYGEFGLAGTIFSRLNQPSNQAKASNRKAYVARLQRNFPKATALATQALAVLEATDAERAYSLLVLGTVQLDLRAFEKAEALFQQALDIWISANDQRMAAWCLTNLGAALRPLQRYEEAIDAYQRAIQIFEEAEDPVHLAVVWMNLGNVNLVQDKPLKALEWYRKAHDVFIQVQEQLRLAQIQMNMGMAHYKLEEWTSAEAFYLLCIKAYEEIGNIERAANGMDALGLTFCQQHRYEEAINTFQAAIDKLIALEHRVSYEPLLKELELHLHEARQFAQSAHHPIK